MNPKRTMSEALHASNLGAEAAAFVAAGAAGSVVAGTPPPAPAPAARRSGGQRIGLRAFPLAGGAARARLDDFPAAGRIARGPTARGDGAQIARRAALHAAGHCRPSRARVVGAQRVARLS